MFRMNISLVAFCCAVCAGLPARVSAADSPPSAGNSYTVKAGDTLDKVIRQQLSGSPLRAEILREALISQNPGAFTKGSPKMLMTGAVLQLPDQEALMRKHFQPSFAPAAAPVVADHASAERSAATRRNWVRYP